ncbi:GIY-YIG nuclease family protein [Amycolatopsis taiwanensis]|uniref:GIY-YIG nuclease family protein n=1 Tax=Amycolatopsis taiwanensis TaxID=342230 RepID=UPI003D7F4F81
MYVCKYPHTWSLKIGQTSRESTERAREISRATGVPAEYEVIYDQTANDAASRCRVKTATPRQSPVLASAG